MALAVYWILSGLVLLSIPVSMYLWVTMLRKHWHSHQDIRESALVVRKRDRPFWSPTDFLLMYVMMIGLMVVIQRITITQGWQTVLGESPSNEAVIHNLIVKTIASALASLGALLTAMAWLRLCNRNWRPIIGLSLSREDWRLGIRGALVILPPVLLITLVVNQFVEYHHPVLDSIAKSPDPMLFGVMFLSTALLTPVVEEFMVRGLLQGGLQGLVDQRTDEFGLWAPRSFWPLVLSSGIFAAMHIGQGAAPVPLFFFSLGLGYLYRQTGRLGPPIIVHAILNGVTLCIAFTGMTSPV